MLVGVVTADEACAHKAVVADLAFDMDFGPIVGLSGFMLQLAIQELASPVRYTDIPCGRLASWLLPAHL